MINHRRFAGFLACGLLSMTAAAMPASAQDSWDAIYLAGAKVGHIHTYIEPVKDRGRDLLRVRIDMELSYKRLNDRITTKLQYGTIETPEGQVLRLDTRILASNQEIRVHGDAIGGKMNLMIDGTGQKQQQSIPWGEEVRGPYAAEQSLSRTPMKAGEARSLKMFMPDLNRVCDIELNAVAVEDVKLGGGVSRPLLKIAQTTKLDGKPRPEFDVTLWADTGGQVLKSMTENLGGMVIYRTTREAALAPSSAAGQFDQITNSVIKVTRKLNRPEATRNVRYRVAIPGEDVTEIIPNDRRQTVSKGTKPGEFILEVRTAGPNDGSPDPTPVDPAFLRPNAMITSADPKIVRTAQRVTSNTADPWLKATRIQKWVAQNLRDKNFQVGFAPASEVIQNLSGDCTEHGVLTAAMCRAVGIPSRVVVGLVYADQLGGFGYHLWNEVHVNQRWVALDSTFDEDAVDAVHIKLSDSSLDGVAPFEVFLPIIRVLGKMSLEPIEIR